jgi:hypothetical protein
MLHIQSDRGESGSRAAAGFTGTNAELLSTQNKVVSDQIRHSSLWPKAPNALSNALRRMASNLRADGSQPGFNRPVNGGSRIFVKAGVKLHKLSTAFGIGLRFLHGGARRGRCPEGC